MLAALGYYWRHFGLLGIYYRNLGRLVGNTNSLILHTKCRLSSSWLCGKKKGGPRVGVALTLAYWISFLDRHGWALWFIPASAHSTMFNLVWRLRAGITKLHGWWMAFWSSEVRELVLFSTGLWYRPSSPDGVRREGRNFCLYLCFRYKYSLPGSPGGSFGYKTDEARKEQI